MKKEVQEETIDRNNTYKNSEEEYVRNMTSIRESFKYINEKLDLLLKIGNDFLNKKTGKCFEEKKEK